jgi:hypothetical protein
MTALPANHEPAAGRATPAQYWDLCRLTSRPGTIALLEAHVAATPEEAAAVALLIGIARDVQSLLASMSPAQRAEVEEDFRYSWAELTRPRLRRAAPPAGQYAN